MVKSTIPLSVLILHQPFRILGPDPQYSQNDCFCQKCSKSTVMSLEQQYQNLPKLVITDKLQNVTRCQLSVNNASVVGVMGKLS